MAREVATRKSASPQLALPLPSLPQSVALAIADPMARETLSESGERIMVPVAWEPPKHRILPELLDDARKHIEAKLAPAGEARAGECLLPLLLTQIMPGTEGMSPETVQQFASAKVPEYARHLAKYPVDLLTAACDAHATSGSKFFPAVFELTSRCEPELTKRQRQRDRINAIIDASNRPAKPQDEVPPWKRQDLSPEERREWEIKRTRELIEMKRKRGGMALNGIERLEAELAKLEGRTVTITPESLGPGLTGNSANAVIVDELEAKPPQAKEWKRPAPELPTQRFDNDAANIAATIASEEPPLPDEIPT